MTFDLLSEPWLPMVDAESGGMSHVGIVDALRNAQRYRRLLGETPTMTAALHRMLLAVVHRVYGPESMAEWGKLWHNGFAAAGDDRLDRYTDRYRDRFDLFHPERPFYQCAALRHKEFGSTTGLVAFRSHGDNRTLFDHTLHTDRPVIPAAEAARWLVTMQLYDPGGLKTPFVKDKSSTRAEGNNFGCVLVEGLNLHQTLLLNTLRYDPDIELPIMTTSDDHPVWEAPEPIDPHPDSGRVPRGWTDLLTWQSRRVLLRPATTDTAPVVDGVVITPGDRLAVELWHVEHSAAYQRATGRGAPLKAIRLEELRGVWRHSRSLLLSDARRWKRGDWRSSDYQVEPQHLRPEVLEHIADAEDYIDADAVYTLRVFGQELTGKSTKIAAWREESVPMSVALLRSEDHRIGMALGEASILAEQLGQALHRMYLQYVRSFQGPNTPDGLSQREKELRFADTALELAYWPRLAAPFGDLLLRLGDSVRRDRIEIDALTAWGDRTATLAQDAAARWADSTIVNRRGLLAVAECLRDFTEEQQKLHRIFKKRIRALNGNEDGP